MAWNLKTTGQTKAIVTRRCTALHNALMNVSLFLHNPEFFFVYNEISQSLAIMTLCLAPTAGYKVPNNMGITWCSRQESPSNIQRGTGTLKTTDQATLATMFFLALVCLVLAILTSWMIAVLENTSKVDSVGKPTEGTTPGLSITCSGDTCALRFDASSGPASIPEFTLTMPGAFHISIEPTESGFVVRDVSNDDSVLQTINQAGPVGLEQVKPTTPKMTVLTGETGLWAHSTTVDVIKPVEAPLFPADFHDQSLWVSPYNLPSVPQNITPEGILVIPRGSAKGDEVPQCGLESEKGMTHPTYNFRFRRPSLF